MMRATMTWTPQQIPALAGRVALVTGANSGIGFEAARELAQHGCTVVLGCRSLARGAEAEAKIRQTCPGATLDVLELDLSRLGSVRAAAATLSARQPRLDLLLNNAGVMAIPRTLSEDGFEMQLATNHLGHFALTGLLLGPLLAAPAARIVNVSSSAHRIGMVRLDDLDRARGYAKWEAYGQSKLANLLFTFELQRRLAGRAAISVACHPGYAATNLQYVGPEQEGSRLGMLFMKLSNRVFAQSAAAGALPTLYAATAAGVQGGDFIGPDGLREMWGAPTKVRARRAAYDVELARGLWTASVQRSGVGFEALDGRA
jgi:NAD(P)-dependent dehydrogenase (short-subunit alcohol dehydrogenase family)